MYHGFSPLIVSTSLTGPDIDVDNYLYCHTQRGQGMTYLSRVNYTYTGPTSGEQEARVWIKLISS